MSPSHSLTMKLLTSTVVFTFFMSSLGITPNTFAAAGVPSPEVSVFSAAARQIPAELGQVTEMIIGNPSAPAFIHIQSAHGNYQAEKNIEKLLGYIEKNSSMKLMLLEGASGKLHPEMFRIFPKHLDFNKKVTDKLMQEGYLTGPETFLIESSQKTEGWGIENLEAYKKDRNAFISVVKSDKTAQAFLLKLRASVDKRFSSKLNKDFLLLVRQEEAFNSGTLPFESWLKILGEASKKHLKQDLSDAFYQGEYPFMIRYHRLQSIGSKIDREKAHREAEAFLKDLATRKVPKEILGSFKSILQMSDIELLKTSGRTADGYSTLRRAFDNVFEKLPKDFSMKNWPNWTLYSRYIILMQEMEGKGLHDETLKMKDKIQSVLAKTPAEKEYLTASRELYLLKRLFSLELTRTEYEELLGKSSANVLSGNDIKAAYTQAMNFYSTAVVREDKMFKNAMNRMKVSKEKRAVIVTGGFHADGLKKLVASQGCSYLQITPHINEVSKRDHEIYLRSIVGSREVETSQMSRALATAPGDMDILDAAQLRTDVRDVVYKLITLEPVSIQPSLARVFARSAFSFETSRFGSLRSEMRALDPGSFQVILDNASNLIGNPDIEQKAFQTGAELAAQVRPENFAALQKRLTLPLGTWAPTALTGEEQDFKDVFGSLSAAMRKTRYGGTTTIWGHSSRIAQMSDALAGNDKDNFYADFRGVPFKGEKLEEEVWNDYVKLGQMYFKDPENLAALRLSNLFHDVGVILQTPSHEPIGAIMVRQILDRLPVSEKVKLLVLWIVGNHLNIGVLGMGERTPRYSLDRLNVLPPELRPVANAILVLLQAGEVRSLVEVSDNGNRFNNVAGQFYIDTADPKKFAQLQQDYATYRLKIFSSDPNGSLITNPKKYAEVQRLITEEMPSNQRSQFWRYLQDVNEWTDYGVYIAWELGAKGLVFMHYLLSQVASVEGNKIRRFLWTTPRKDAKAAAQGIESFLARERTTLQDLTLTGKSPEQIREIMDKFRVEVPDNKSSIKFDSNSFRAEMREGLQTDQHLVEPDTLSEVEKLLGKAERERLVAIEREFLQLRSKRVSDYENPDSIPAGTDYFNLGDRLFDLKQELERMQETLKTKNTPQAVRDDFGKAILYGVHAHKVARFLMPREGYVSVIPFESQNRFTSQEGPQKQYEILRHQVLVHPFPFQPDGISLSEAQNPPGSEQDYHWHPYNESVISLSDGVELRFRQRDATGVVVEKIVPVKYGQVISVPANTYHTIKNPTSRPSADTCLKNPILQLVKTRSSIVNEQTGRVLEPKQVESYDWGMSFTYPFDLPSRLALTAEHVPILSRDTENNLIPSEISPIAGDFHLITIKDKYQTTPFPFKSTYDQIQMLRIYPWPRSIPADWVPKKNTKEIRGEIVFLDDRGIEIGTQSFKGGDLLVLNNHGKKRPIKDFYIRNKSDQHQMMVGFLEPDETSITEQTTRDESPQLLVFDLDDTLAESNKEIDPETLQLLISALQQGSHIAIFSAKSTDRIETRLRKTSIPAVLRERVWIGSTGEGVIKSLNASEPFFRGKSMSIADKERIKQIVRNWGENREMREVPDAGPAQPGTYTLLERKNSIIVGHLNWLSAAERSNVTHEIERSLRENRNFSGYSVTTSGGTLAIGPVIKSDLIDGILSKVPRVKGKSIFVAADSLNGNGNDRPMLTKSGMTSFYVGRETPDVRYKGDGRIHLLPESGVLGVKWLLRRLNRIFWFGMGQPTPDVSLIGGKGHGLAEFDAVGGMNAPAGFVVTTENYKQFLEENQLNADIRHLDKLSEKLIDLELRNAGKDEIKGAKKDVESLRKAIENKISRGIFPAAVRTALLESFHRLKSMIGTEDVCMVRSASVTEDSKNASAAGQHYSEYAISTDEEYEVGVIRVFASLFSKEAVDYRIKNRKENIAQNDLAQAAGFAHSAAPMAVVTSRMIPAVASGAAFSVDIRKNRKGILIESIRGMGAPYADNEVTPSHWLFDEKGEKLLEYKIVPQDRGEFFDPRTRKTVKRSLPPTNQFKEPLTLGQAREIARAIARAREYFGRTHGYAHIDIEYAVDPQGKISFVQVRPVTTHVDETADPMILGVDLTKLDDSKIMIRVDGEIASVGTVIGRSVIVSIPESQNPERDNVELALKYIQPGDILITPTTNIGWTPLFDTVGGVISERGGVMSHTAIIAREKHRPAIVGAWGLIRDLKQKFDSRATVLENGSVIILPEITMDAVNGRMYVGKQPLVEKRLSELLVPSQSAGLDEYYNQRQEVPHYKDDAGREWTGKPEYPLSPLQFDVFFQAWQRAFQRLHIDSSVLPLFVSTVTPSTVQNEKNKLGTIQPGLDAVKTSEQYRVIAFPTDDLARLGDLIREHGFSKGETSGEQGVLDELIAFNEERMAAYTKMEAAMEDFRQKGDIFKVTDLLRCYVEITAFSHIRAGFRRRVVGPLRVEILKGLQGSENLPTLINKLLMIVATGLFTKTTHEKDVEYRQLMLEIYERPDLQEGLLSKPPTEALAWIQSASSEIYDKLVEHATKFKIERSLRDQIEKPLALPRLMELIQNDLSAGRNQEPISELFIRTMSGYDVELERMRPLILDKNPKYNFETFKKIMRLAWEIPAETDNERHLENQLQRVLHSALVAVEKELKQDGLMNNDASVFDLKLDDLASLIGKRSEVREISGTMIQAQKTRESVARSLAGKQVATGQFRSEMRMYEKPIVPQVPVVDASSLGAKIRTAIRVAENTVSPLLSISPVYASEIAPELFAGTDHYQKAAVVPVTFAAKWPVFSKIIRHFADASAARMVIDQRQGVPDEASVLPLVTFARYNPKAAVVLALIADAWNVSAFEKSLTTLSPKQPLPANFKVQAFANEDEFVTEFQEFYNSSVPFGRPVALVTDREQSIVTAKIGSRKSLLSVVGDQNPLKQTASALLAANKLLDESIWSRGYHFVSIDKLGGLEALMAELTGFVAAQARMAASA